MSTYEMRLCPDDELDSLLRLIQGSQFFPQLTTRLDVSVDVHLIHLKNKIILINYYYIVLKIILCNYIYYYNILLLHQIQ